MTRTPYRYFLVLFSAKWGYVSNYSAAKNGMEHLQFTTDPAKASFWELDGRQEAPEIRVKYSLVWHCLRKTADKIVDEDLEVM